MLTISKGKNRGCKGNIGGFITIYLFPFEKYRRSQIITDGQELVEFPTTTVYPFYVTDASFNESTNEDKSVTQNLTFNLNKIEVNPEVLRLLKKDYRAIIFSRNGYYKLVGAFNGMTTNLQQTTGGSQSEFSGYQITMQGDELNEAFIFDNLEDVGFEIYDPLDFDNYIFTNEDNYIFEDGNNFIFN